MLEPLKGLFRGSRGATGGGPPSRPSAPRTPLSGRGSTAEPILSARPSRGLEEFFTQIRDTSGLTILDLGGATQKNVSFITDLGHRLYSEDFLRILNETFGTDDELRERVSLVGGESLVYWLRKLVFRSAWLDHQVKRGALEVVWDEREAEFAYQHPGGRRPLLELAPVPSWHELQFRG